MGIPSWREIRYRRFLLSRSWPLGECWCVQKKGHLFCRTADRSKPAARVRSFIVFCHRFVSASYEYYLLKKTFPGKIASIHYCNALTSHSFGWRSHILGRNIVFQTFHIAHVLKLWIVLIIVGVCLKLGSYKLKKNICYCQLRVLSVWLNL